MDKQRKRKFSFSSNNNQIFKNNHRHNNNLTKRQSNNDNHNLGNTPSYSPAKKRKKTIMLNDNNNNNKRDLHWIYPTIPIIIKKLRHKIDLRNISYKLEDAFNSRFLHNYVDEKELFTKDEKVKGIIAELLRLYNHNFLYILKTYNMILSKYLPVDDEFIEQYKKVYKTFMASLNSRIEILSQMKISYEMWIKYIINENLLVERAKAYPNTIESLENCLLYIALFEYYHPVRNPNGMFEYSFDLYHNF